MFWDVYSLYFIRFYDIPIFAINILFSIIIFTLKLFDHLFLTMIVCFLYGLFFACYDVNLIINGCISINDIDLITDIYILYVSLKIIKILINEKK